MVENHDGQGPDAVVEDGDSRRFGSAICDHLGVAIGQVRIPSGVVGSGLREPVLPGPAGVAALIVSDRVVGDHHVTGIEFEAAEGHAEDLGFIGILAGRAGLAGRIRLVDPGIEGAADSARFDCSSSRCDDGRSRGGFDARFVENPDLRGRRVGAALVLQLLDDLGQGLATVADGREIGRRGIGLGMTEYQQDAVGPSWRRMSVSSDIAVLPEADGLDLGRHLFGGR